MASVVVGIAVLALVAVYTLSDLWGPVGHGVQPSTARFQAQPVPVMPAADDVAEMAVRLYSTPFFQVAPTQSFSVPKQFHKDVCSEFQGKIYANDYLQRMSARVGDRRLRDPWKLGDIHFKLRSGSTFDVTFYGDIGMGTINFSVGRGYYSAITRDEGGGVSLHFLLRKAMEAAGVSTPPPYPPPILTDEDVISITISLVQRGPSEPQLVNHRIPDNDISTVMRWLRGAHEVVPLPWSDAEQLGTLNLALRDGTAVALQYYRAPAGELRFSTMGVHYRLMNHYTSSDNLDDEIRFVIRSEVTDSARASSERR